MKKICVFIILICTCIAIYAQTITITGTIRDRKTNNTIPFANVMLMSDTTLSAEMISGATSNKDGKFAIKTKEKKPVLKFNSLGYQDNVLTINIASYTAQKSIINIGDVYLSADTTNLKEVSIIGKQTRLEMDNDKIVMNVDEGVSATSANAFEMLRKVPGVVIDKDENITLNGQSGILFQFDGRDIRIPYESMKAILKGMSPRDIAKIETITNPSAKYEAEGTAGIINIIMAKEQTAGFSGNVSSWSGVNEDFKTFDNVSLSYVNSKWTLSGGLGFGIFNNRSEQEFKQYVANNSNDTTLMHNEKNTQKNKFRNMNADFSVDYKINDNNSIGGMITFSANKSPYVDNEPQIVAIRPYPYNDVTSSYRATSQYKSSSQDYMGSIYYNHKFDSIGGQFSTSFDFTHDNSNGENKSTNNYFSGYIQNLLRNETNFSETENKYDSYSFKFDVVQPFNKRMTLEYGIKSRLAIIDNDFKAYLNDVLDANTTNHLKYKENINAAYVSFSDKVTDKFSFRAGLRFEHTYTNLEQKATNEEFDNNYVNLFPNLNISYKVGKMDNISLTYSYRISRPEYNSLNPFVVKNSDYSYSSGNPYLDPQYTHNFNLNYAFHYIVFLTASYGYTNDNISEIFQPSANTLALTQKPFNLGYKQNASVGLSSMLPLGPIEWTLWLQGAYSQIHCDNELLKTNIEKFSFMTWQSLAIEFFWKTKLTGSVFYSTGGVEMGGEYSDMLMLSASISKEFLQKQLKVSMGVDNFPKRDFNIATHYTGYRLDGVVAWQKPQFTVNLTYSFGRSANNNTLKRIQSDNMDSRSSGESSIGQGNQGTSQPMGQ